jgi:hypothetical protein
VPTLWIVQKVSREGRTEFLEHRHQLSTRDLIAGAIVGNRQSSTCARDLNVERWIVGQHTGVDVN